MCIRLVVHKYALYEVKYRVYSILRVYEIMFGDTIVWRIGIAAYVEINL